MRLSIYLVFILLPFSAHPLSTPAKVFIYPLPPIYAPSSVFVLEAGGENVPVVSYNPKYDYAHFSMSEGAVQVSVTLLDGQEVASANISPQKLHINGAIKGRTLSFTLNRDEYLIVKINQLKELIIAADPEEKGKPASKGKNIFNITTYKADAAGRTLSTPAFQKAIDEASAAGKGIVYVPAGVYLLGNLQLKSNMSLYLEGGAVLRFTGNAKDYKVNARKASQKRDLTWWIYTDSGAHNIKIYGRGTLDGNGKYATDTGHIGNNILALFYTRHFILDGLIIRESGTWALIPTRSKDIIFRNFKLFNRFDMGENDGIDVMESENVLVQHAIGIALDDPFSTKTWEQNTDLCRNWPGHPLPQHNIVFEDLLSWTYCYAYKIGQGVMQPQTDIVFKDCVVYDAAVGIGIHHKWGTSYVKHVVFDNIDIERLSYKNDDNRVWATFFMQNGDKKGSGPITDILIRNINIYDLGKSPGKIKGAGGTALVNGVIFRNVHIPGQIGPATTLEQMHMTDTIYCRNIKIL